MKKIIDFFKNDEGATVPEYALMLGVIAAVVVIAVQTIGTKANGIFEYVGENIPDPGAAAPE